MDTSARVYGTAGLADEFLFGDPQLHARLHQAGELIACLMQAAPAALTTSALAEHIGQPQHGVQILLAGLHGAGLVQQDSAQPDVWFRQRHDSSVTLADIFLSISGQIQTTTDGEVAAPASPTHRQVDILLGQATMSINQLVIRQLRQFDLGRYLTAAASSRRYQTPLAASETD